MSDCPACGESVTDDRPRHRVVLEVEDTTRSTKQFMGDEANLKRCCFDQQLCADCWNDVHERLSAD
jgi:hypothetical protein